MVHRLVGDEGHVGRAVGVEHGDVHVGGAARRHAGAVAIVGSGERDQVIARTVKAGGPREHE